MRLKHAVRSDHQWNPLVLGMMIPCAAAPVVEQSLLSKQLRGMAGVRIYAYEKSTPPDRVAGQMKRSSLRDSERLGFIPIAVDVLFGDGSTAHSPGRLEQTRPLADTLRRSSGYIANAPEPKVDHGIADVLRRSGPLSPTRRKNTLHDAPAVPAVIRRSSGAGDKVQYGRDPKEMIGGQDGDLLYGINIPRGETKARLTSNQRNRLRTIDEYNRAVGINKIMTQNGAAMGLYRVRGALAAAEWDLDVDPNLDTVNREPTLKWIGFLRDNGDHIGLNDLGRERAGKKNKIDKKHRFKKNRAESQANDNKADQLSPEDTREFLDHGRDIDAAQGLYDRMSPVKQEALNKWVYRAFFRRTSKLGQKFAIEELGARVHFNTAADPDYDELRGPTWQHRGLEKMNKSGKNSKNRPITVSEYRHMAKLKKQHPGRFNVYSEI